MIVQLIYCALTQYLVMVIKLLMFSLAIRLLLFLIRQGLPERTQAMVYIENLASISLPRLDQNGTSDCVYIH